MRYDASMNPEIHASKPLIYLGCALSNSPQNFKDHIEILRSVISPHATVLKFLGLDHPNVGDVFQYDANCVRRCDLMIADVTYPSIGLGIEFGLAVENRKPIITLADDKLALKRQMTFGYWDPLHYKLRYKTAEEAAEFVVGKILELFPGASK